MQRDAEVSPSISTVMAVMMQADREVQRNRY
jgi:hypothetical protein